MNPTNYQQGVFTRKCIAFTEFTLLISIVITLLLKLHLIFLLNIDVDEFRFLSTVYQYQRGWLHSPLFTFHVHLFSWLPLIARNEVIQIFAARAFMYVLGLGSCIFIYLIGRLFFDRSGALFSVLCYLSISNVIVHGASFRFDPVCVFLFLCSIYLLLRKPHSRLSIIAAGFSMALSLMVSLKTLLYVPAIGAIFLFQIYLAKDRKAIFKEALLFSVSLVISFVLLYHFHLSALSTRGLSGKPLHTMELHTKGLHIADRVVRDLSPRSIIPERLFPESGYLLLTLVENLIIWFYWLMGVILLFRDLVSRKNGHQSKHLLLLPLLIPLIVLIFYKFPYAYFYVFIISPAIILSAAFIERVVEGFKKKHPIFVPILVFILSLGVLMNFFRHYDKNAFDQTVAQRETVQLIHKIFPKPVPYLDRCSMISSYPQAGLQMTTWDMEKYTEANTPIMREVLIRHQPLFIVANSVHLDLSVPRGTAKDIFRNYPLLEADYNVLKENFIHHWGPLYVAGKQFDFDSNSSLQTFEVLIPGTYTIEANSKVSLNGVTYEPGSKVELQRTTYTIVPQSNPMKVTLRWGEGLYKPVYKPSTQPIFLGYYLQALKMRR